MTKEIKSFTDLLAWKEAHIFTVNIYKITKAYPKEETYGLISQIRRSSSSIMANISEGFGRFHYKDKIKFYHQSRGSLSETQNHLYLSKSLNYINEKDLLSMIDKNKNLGQLINGLINSTKKQLNKS
ncbi:MAG TPA: four helix bundle protein [Patescibacteria group bacterium]|nr:four helix bundle protein [Patescibacteria group bacterium]